MEIGVIIRVFACCIVFAYFVTTSLQSRFRYSRLKTNLLIVFLIVITMVVVALFLIPDQNFSEYNIVAIFFWIITAITIFRASFKGSYLELLFIVLVVLNLYVNIVAIAKVIVNGMGGNYSDGVLGTFVTVGVLIAYLPLLWALFFGLYKKIIELHIDVTLWKVIWVIPALTYVMFYVKIVNDYWVSPIQSGSIDMFFIVLWSFTTYTFFLVTLQMLYQVYRGVITEEEMKLVASQLRMQEGQCKRLLDNIENTAKVRHDWRHHLLSMNGFAENGDQAKLKEYLSALLPVYVTNSEESVCRNHVVDVILLHYAAKAREQGVTVEIKVDIPERIGISDTDLCIVFGNLTENAVEACISSAGGNKMIKVTAYMKGEQLVVMLKNTYKNRIIMREGIYYSTKHEGAGIGLSSVSRVAKKYNGSVKVEYSDRCFTVFSLMNAYMMK